MGKSARPPKSKGATRGNQITKENESVSARVTNVQPVITEVVRAYNLTSTREFLEKVSVYGSSDGGDSEPGRDAILKYEKTDRVLSDTFASLVLDYIDTYPPPSDEHSNHAKEQVIRWCREAIRSPSARHQRYAGPLRSDAASVSSIDKIKAVYGVIRHDTGDAHLLQDLLILEHVSKGDSGTYATLVTPEVICRGSWCLLKHTIHVTMSGRRVNFRGDAVTFEFARDVNETRILGGVLLGPSSDMSLPALVPVVAIRIPDADVHSNIYALGDENDACLRNLYKSLKTKMPKSGEKLDFTSNLLSLIGTRNKDGKIGWDLTKGLIVDPRDISSESKNYEQPEKLILPELRDFVRKDPRATIDAWLLSRDATRKS
jgi:hypothetical protein